MDDELLTLAMLALSMAGIVVYLVVTYIKDLGFYRRNGWDFSQDSSIDRYSNDSTDEASKMSNVDRIYLSHPLGLIVCIVMFAAICFVIYQKL